MSQEVRGNDAPFILNAVERAIIRVPRSSHHGLTKIPTAAKIAGRTYLDLSLLTDINMSRLPEVVLAARLYHLAHTHHTLVATGQCALWAHGYGSDPTLPPITVATSSAIRPIVLPEIAIGTHTFAPMKVKARHVRHLPAISDTRGLLIENLESAQITAARTSSNRRAAFTQMCMNAHTYTHFDNFHMKASRNNEESWKFFLERELKQLGNRARGRSQAQWIITHADAGCASPGEARVPSSTDEPNTGTTPAASTRHFPASASANATSRPRGGTSYASAGTTSIIRTSSLHRSAPHSPRAWGESTTSDEHSQRLPPLHQRRSTMPRRWGFGSIRSPVTACRRRVAPLMLQSPPPAFHVQAAETSCNRPTRPTPRPEGARQTDTPSGPTSNRTTPCAHMPPHASPTPPGPTLVACTIPPCLPRSIAS